MPDDQTQTAPPSPPTNPISTPAGAAQTVVNAAVDVSALNMFAGVGSPLAGLGNLGGTVLQPSIFAAATLPSQSAPQAQPNVAQPSQSTPPSAPAENHNSPYSVTRSLHNGDVVNYNFAPSADGKTTTFTATGANSALGLTGQATGTIVDGKAHINQITTIDSEGMKTIHTKANDPAFVSSYEGLTTGTYQLSQAGALRPGATPGSPATLPGDSFQNGSGVGPSPAAAAVQHAHEAAVAHAAQLAPHVVPPSQQAGDPSRTLHVEQQDRLGGTTKDTITLGADGKPVAVHEVSTSKDGKMTITSDNLVVNGQVQPGIIRVQEAGGGSMTYGTHTHDPNGTQLQKAIQTHESQVLHGATAPNANLASPTSAPAADHASNGHAQSAAIAAAVPSSTASAATLHPAAMSGPAPVSQHVQPVFMSLDSTSKVLAQNFAADSSNHGAVATLARVDPTMASVELKQSLVNAAHKDGMQSPLLDNTSKVLAQNLAADTSNHSAVAEMARTNPTQAATMIKQSLVDAGHAEPLATPASSKTLTAHETLSPHPAGLVVAQAAPASQIAVKSPFATAVASSGGSSMAGALNRPFNNYMIPDSKTGLTSPSGPGTFPKFGEDMKNHFATAAAAAMNASQLKQATRGATLSNETQGLVGAIKAKAQEMKAAVAAGMSRDEIAKHWGMKRAAETGQLGHHGDGGASALAEANAKLGLKAGHRHFGGGNSGSRG